ncbi:MULTISPECIES: ATP-binding cassette domain-containing protein [Pseudoalteromonas]|jgi:cationic peptide transport system ATP-binding protein|uniref:ATP-binding cassette domain-containing protein n=3 Tax=Pseudoalteromonas TaxID=53246 RepID=A0AAD0TZC0_9GAMM|nr:MULTISPECIES: ATP-binding cassette domain-containing protein [Pseudoalteromonas]MCP4056017.1 ATP-binding cassette domain-containing protein [Pseudoalteromonas sp.]MDC9520527.1 ATP-binding cassette domain-containing protein [Pseudoalteromonas sp. Angola-31]MDY6889068.1 ATP-binding cassette domain-containing protein [Pseudomonadota bacterium]GEK76319.1 ABC transporter ATP-binding protein [Pseudoalteromonas atlantica]ATC81684.1 dipeptide transport system ATP-binding protein [Pseudoalteromonas |tara:strand:+ start:3786 stop:4547 length:762 start_codon:yes stop_codon:yes gene_type:complete
MQPVLKVQALCKTFNIRAGLFSRKKFEVLKNISFCVGKGETIAVIGETGAGKSTLAKLLAGADSADSGQILLESNIIEDDGVRDDQCRHIRMIFQDSAASLNPGLTIGDMLDDCLQYNTDSDQLARQEKIDATLSKVGLLIDHQHYYPHMFSVGQLQRVALARALILDPKVVVLDEALSALDPSVRAQTVNLLLKLQKETGLTYVLITHHLSLVRHISDQLVVLEKGEVVEYGRTEEVFQNPQSKVTQRLICC